MARILVIDDDEQVREILRLKLSMDGHEVMSAVDGADGLALFHQNKADLVITDILMPKKEGIQTIMELRQEFPDLKIVAISGGGALGPEKYLSMAMDLGADLVLTKPFSLKELEEKINRLLEAEGRSGGAAMDEPGPS